MFVMVQNLILGSTSSESQFGDGAAIRNVLVAAVASTGWVTLEWLRGKLLFGGFPWNFLGVTQWRAGPLIQFASVTGVYGVSALVCFVNVVLYFTIRRFVAQMRTREKRWRLSWEFYMAMSLICLAFWHGVPLVFQHYEAKQRIVRLALVQGDIPQTLKFEPEQKPMILERYRTLTEAVMAARPEIIIWPETATPDALRYDRESFELVTNLAVKSGAYLFTGTVDITPVLVACRSLQRGDPCASRRFPGRNLSQAPPRALRRVRAAPKDFSVHEMVYGRSPIVLNGAGILRCFMRVICGLGRSFASRTRFRICTGTLWRVTSISWSMSRTTHGSKPLRPLKCTSPTRSSALSRVIVR